MCDTVGWRGLKGKVHKKTVLIVWAIADKVSEVVRVDAEKRVKSLAERLAASGCAVTTLRSQPDASSVSFEVRHIVQFAVTADVILSLYDHGLMGFGKVFRVEIERYGPGLLDRCVLCAPRWWEVGGTEFVSLGKTMLYDSIDEIIEYVGRC